MPDVRRARRLAWLLVGVAAGVTTVIAIAMALARPPAPEAPGAAGAPRIDPTGGLDWRRVDLPPAIAQLQDVEATGGLLVALGSPALPGAGPTLAASHDGETWTLVPPAALAGDQPFDLQASGDRILVGAGRVNPNGDARRLRLYASTDGLSWASWLPARAADPVADRVVPLGTGWAAIDQRGVVSSPDGTSWTVDLPIPEGEERPLLAGGGRRAVVALSASNDDGGWRSTILIGEAPGRWHRVLLEGGANALVQDVAIGAGDVVAIGLGLDHRPAPDQREWGFEDLSPQLRPVAWWSPDGTSWTRAAWQVPTDDEIGLAPFGRGFVAWSTFTGALWWTDDGNRWMALEPAPWAREGVFALVVAGGRLHGFTWGDTGAVEWIGTPRRAGQLGGPDAGSGEPWLQRLMPRPSGRHASGASGRS